MTISHVISTEYGRIADLGDDFVSLRVCRSSIIEYTYRRGELVNVRVLNEIPERWPSSRKLWAPGGDQ